MNDYKTDLPLENGGVMRLVSRPHTKSWSIYYFDASGERHNLYGPAINHNNRTKMWFIHGKRHRVNAPAFITCIGEIWYYDGMIHRLTGPAQINKETNTISYFINDKEYSKNRYNIIMFWVKTSCNIFKKKLRTKYTKYFQEINFSNEKALYNIISSYII